MNPVHIATILKPWVFSLKSKLLFVFFILIPRKSHAIQSHEVLTTANVVMWLYDQIIR